MATKKSTPKNNMARKIKKERIIVKILLLNQLSYTLSNNTNFYFRKIFQKET